MTTLVQWLNRVLYEMERPSRWVSATYPVNGQTEIADEQGNTRMADFDELMAAVGQLEFPAVVAQNKIWRRTEAIKAVGRGELQSSWIPNWDPEEEVEDEA